MTDRRADEDALRGLSLAYASACDRRDRDRFAELFTPDGELVVPADQETGRAAVVRAGREQLRKVPAALERYHATLHQLTNHEFWYPSPGAATGIVLAVAHHVAAPDWPRSVAGTDTVWYVRYEDVYVRTGPMSEWRFRRRQLHLLWLEERTVRVVA